MAAKEKPKTAMQMLRELPMPKRVDYFRATFDVLVEKQEEPIAVTVTASTPHQLREIARFTVEQFGLVFLSIGPMRALEWLLDRKEEPRQQRVDPRRGGHRPLQS